MKFFKSGLSLILALALLAGLGGGALAESGVTDLSFWIFTEVHQQFYQPGIDAWNKEFPIARS